MNFYKKYLKYKNKYLNLKGGEFQLSPTFIDKIDSIIKHIKKIDYTRSNPIGDFDSKNIINRLIFNILLYGGFIFRKETIIDGDTGQSRQLIDNNGIFLNNEPRITCILKENYIFNSSNPTEISCEVKRIIDLLKRYSNYYYDNFPEIFNYNNHNIPSKSVDEYNLNDLFCLLFMIMKDISNSDRYFGILTQINHITILNDNYIQLDLNVTYNEFYKIFKNNLTIPFLINNTRIFNDIDNRIDICDLKNINFNKSTTYNKYLLFNIPNLIDTFDEIMFNNSDDPRIQENTTLYLNYNTDDINDFNLLINFEDKIVNINNLIKNMPDILYILRCVIRYSILLDYNYHQVYIDPDITIDIDNNYIITYEGPTSDNLSLKKREGIKQNIHYDELHLLSSYWDNKLNPECKKDNAKTTSKCTYFPILTDHPGFLVKFRNGRDIIKFLSLSISEYQQYNRGSQAMPLDRSAFNYFNRIRHILYLLIKILKKEDIECCLIQELFKTSECNPSHKSSSDLTYDRKNTIFLFIKGYLNLYDYDIQDVPYNNNIIYKKNYEVLSNNIISRKEFTSILIGNVSICSVKFKSSDARILTLIHFYLICISATIFNTYIECNEIIIMGDFNLKRQSNGLNFFITDNIIYGPSVDHAVIIRRENMLRFINEINFGRIFNPITEFISIQLRNMNPPGRGPGRGNDVDTINRRLQAGLQTYTSTEFRYFRDILALINNIEGDTVISNATNRYHFLLAIFYLCNYFLTRNRFVNVSSTAQFDLTNFHDFSNAVNLECLFSAIEDVNNRSYLWYLIQFLYNNI